MTCFADVIAGNLGGPSPRYDTTTGNVIGNDFSSNNLGAAVSFVPNASGIVNSVQVALDCILSGFCTSNFTVSIDQNNHGVPGSAIETYTVSVSALGISGNPNPTVVLSSISHPLLGAGTEYWISITNDGDSTGVWHFNQTADISPTATSVDGGATWNNAFLTPSAYEIDGRTVPEPSSLGLILGSGLMLGLCRKITIRRNQPK
jgi:hypothetical protein